MNEERPHISIVEIVIVMSVTFLSDLFDVVSDLSLAIPVVGEVMVFFSRIVSALVWGGGQIWLIMRKVRGPLQFLFGAGSVADAVVPFAQTVTLATTIFFANAPTIAPAAALETAVALGGSATATPMAGGPVEEAQEQQLKEAPRLTGEERDATPPQETEEGVEAEEAFAGEEIAKKSEEAPEEDFGVEPLGKVKEFEAVRKLTEELPQVQ